MPFQLDIGNETADSDHETQSSEPLPLNSHLPTVDFPRLIGLTEQRNEETTNEVNDENYMNYKKAVDEMYKIGRQKDFFRCLNIGRW